MVNNPEAIAEMVKMCQQVVELRTRNPEQFGTCVEGTNQQVMQKLQSLMQQPGMPANGIGSSSTPTTKHYSVTPTHPEFPSQLPPPPHFQATQFSEPMVPREKFPTCTFYLKNRRFLWS